MHLGDHVPIIPLHPEEVDVVFLGEAIAMVVLLPLGRGVVGRVAVHLHKDIPAGDIAVEFSALEVVTHGVLYVLGLEPLMEPVFTGRS